MKRRWKKHKNRCNGKFVLGSKGIFGNTYQCNKCEFKTIKRKRNK